MGFEMTSSELRRLLSMSDDRLFLEELRVRVV
jgi:hypothetical protein